MSYTGTVEHGLVKLPPEARWADGTNVRIEKIETETSCHPVHIIQRKGKHPLGSVDRTISEAEIKEALAEFP